MNQNMPQIFRASAQQIPGQDDRWLMELQAKWSFDVVA
jgi:hypothetical protein